MFTCHLPNHNINRSTWNKDHQPPRLCVTDHRRIPIPGTGPFWHQVRGEKQCSCVVCCASTTHLFWTQASTFRHTWGISQDHKDNTRGKKKKSRRQEYMTRNPNKKQPTDLGIFLLLFLLLLIVPAQQRKCRCSGNPPTAAAAPTVPSFVRAWIAVPPPTSDLERKRNAQQTRWRDLFCLHGQKLTVIQEKSVGIQIPKKKKRVTT